MILQTTEGIVLRTTPFRDHDRILTVFTKHHGVIKLIAKSVTRPKNRKHALLEPLVKAEFVYQQGTGEIYKCQESSILNHNFALRQHLPGLRMTCEWLNCIQNSQPLNKATPLLYQLLDCFLKQIPRGQSMLLHLDVSFRLKLLKHDGLYNIQHFCAECQSPLKTYYLCSISHANYCHKHTTPHAVAFDSTEIQCLEYLTLCRQFLQFTHYPLNVNLHAKVCDYFKKMYS